MTVLFNLFPQLARALRPACQTIHSDTAKFLEAAASANAPVDTGFMSGAIYSITPKYGSTYGQAGTPPGDSYYMEAQEPQGPDESVVGCAANYSVYVNYGTRFQSAQPFWEPAIEQAAQVFPEEGAKLEVLLLTGI